MSMNEPQEITNEGKVAVVKIIADGILNRTDKFGVHNGGYFKMLNIWEIWQLASKLDEDVTVSQIQLIIDALIRLPESSPIRFLRRPLKGQDWIWYGISKKGWLFLDQRDDFDVPPEAIVWANSPNKEPTPEQIAQNEANGGQRLQRIIEMKTMYEDLQRAKMQVEATQKTEEEISASKEEEIIPGLDPQHPANTGEGMPKFGSMLGVFGKKTK